MNNYVTYKARRFIKNLIANLLFTGYKLQAQHKVDARWHSLFISECTFSPWKADAEFLELNSKIEGFTLVDINKQYLAYSYIKQLCKLGVEGDYLEVGVWRGGLSALLGMTFQRYSAPNNKRILYLADTFTGMPEICKENDNYYQGGELADTSEKVVQNLFNACGLNNQLILAGIFPNETAHLIKSNALAFVHIDVDIYESAKNTFEYCWEKVSINGMVVFDDYGYSSTEGVTTFINQVVMQIPDALVIYNMGGHAVVIKIKPNIGIQHT